jgi:hypothetical protein
LRHFYPIGMTGLSLLFTDWDGFTVLRYDY